MPNFELSHNLTYSISKFHSGEVQVTCSQPTPPYQAVTINGSITSSDHIIELLQLVDAIRFAGTQSIDLVMPYCAFSRQDRRCNPGEAFSLGVFADLINSCNFDSVTTLDNHSDVATALIHNCHNVPVHELLPANLQSYDFFISPDAGANKKVQLCCKYYSTQLIRADKVRDPLTMNITHTEVYATKSQLDGATVLIIDDIVAGGRTFVELAKSLKVIQPNVTIHLYVTHPFYQFGKQKLVEAGISKFLTYDE